MPAWGDEIQAGVDSGVMATEQGAFYLELFFKVLFKLGIDVFKNGFKTIKKERDFITFSINERLLRILLLY